MEIKGELKAAGISCRLVVSKDQALSSVVVKKNKCHEFLVLGKKWLGETCVVQDFEDYGLRDYGRPVRDLISGSMPPKLAQIMINLAQVPLGEKILDPFCGSGTIIQEGMLLGYKMVGSDISDKAVKDTKENIVWLLNNLAVKSKSWNIYQADVKELAWSVKQADAVVTEPYLGPPLRGSEKLKDIEKIIGQLSELYDAAFGQFLKILNPGSRVVIVFPAFRVGKDILELPVLPRIKKLGFTQLNKDKLVYSREGQKVWRQIYVFQR
jgi:tRNA G10  N-methylase Trm11